MLRGVSKQIVEINDTGNKYFDRAVLYVSHEFIGNPDEKLHAEAQRLVAAMERPPMSASRAKKRLLLGRALLISSYPVLALIVFLLSRAA